VKKELGTGDSAKEREWEEVMQEIGKQDNLYAREQKRKELRAAKKDAKKHAAQADDTEDWEHDAARKEGDVHERFIDKSSNVVAGIRYY
jgi:hypothetical protein